MGEGGARVSAHTPKLRFGFVPMARLGLGPKLFVTLEPEEGSKGEDRGPWDERKSVKLFRSGEGVLLPRENQEPSTLRVYRTRTIMIAP